MMLQLLQADPGRYFAIVIVVVVSIVLHELAHGFAAIKLGDRTPIETGHMTLNPIVHMGWVSLIMLAVIGMAWGMMPVDTRRLRGKYGNLWVSAAGPAMNLALAAIGIGAMGLLLRTGTADGDSRVMANGWILLWELGRTNVALFLLNMIPVPPLDGSRMLASLSPGYRRLLTGEASRGFMSAMLFALFLGGGRYIFAAAESTALHGVLWVAGQHA